MKIGFDAKRYFANYTGLGNYSRTLIENLVTYHPENQYLLYTHGKDLETADQFPISDPMVSVMTPGTRLGRSNGALWRSFFLTRDLALNKPDIYHGLSHEIPVGIQHLKGLKTVVTIHDLIFLRYPRFYRWSERAIYLRKFKYSCRHADRIVSVSEQTKQDIIQFFGTPAEKIETVYQSCDPVFLLPVSNIKRRRIKERYQLPDQYVLYVGSFNERKNLSSLIDGLAIMKRNLDVPLVMIGSGKQYKSTVIEKIKKLGLNHRVLILSDVPNK
ncbi:MAG: glycosyltransferase family 1 protein, partial [bacterium]